MTAHPLQLPTILVTGPPGSGKSTLVQVLQAQFEAAVFALRLRSRMLVRMAHPLAERIEEAARRDLIMPDALVEAVLKDFVGTEAVGRALVLEGLPISEAQVQIVNRVLAMFGRNLTCHVRLSCDEQVLRARVQARYICAACEAASGAGHPVSGEDACRRCGGPLRRRSDDAAFDRRMALHREFRDRTGDSLWPERTVAVDSTSKDTAEVAREVLAALPTVSFSTESAALAFLRQHEVIVFDVDDTLVATFDTAWARTRSALRRLSVEPVTRDEFEAVYGRTAFPACAEVWRPGIDISAFVAAYADVKPDYPYAPLTDISRLFGGLSDAGHRVCVLTNSPRHSVLSKLPSNGLEHVHHLFCGEDLPIPKPDGSGFGKLTTLTGLSPTNHIYVGDSPADRDAARAAEVSFIAVDSGPWRTPTHHRLSSVDQILRAILR